MQQGLHWFEYRGKRNTSDYYIGKNMSMEKVSVFPEDKEYLQQKNRCSTTLNSPDIDIFRNSCIMSDL